MTAGLLSPNGSVEQQQRQRRRRFSLSRTLSLPYGSRAPAPSPRIPPSASDGGSSSQQDGQDRLDLKPSTSRMLFRSRSSQGPPPQPRDGRDTFGMMALSQRQSRSNSVTFEDTPDIAYWSSSCAAVALLTAATRDSINYDLSSYQAKRLLNLTEETSQDSNSLVTEIHCRTSVVSRRHSIAQQSDATTPTSPMPRVNSDMSLYTPMRRRSILTPGVATRAPDPPIPIKSKARFSLPTTPMRRDSIESTGIGILSFPPATVGPDAIPRALTPCDENYRHTGVFKLGSLRITNGSPVRSPVLDDDSDDEDSLCKSPKAIGTRKGFQQARPTMNIKLETETQNSVASDMRDEGPRFQTPLHPISTSVQSPNSENYSSSSDGSKTLARISVAPAMLPKIQLSPRAWDAPASPLGLQTTSKHTAVEDDLFEEEPQEYSTCEVLDVRIDLNAKSLPPRPKLISQSGKSQGIQRSDSGIAASPTTSESSPKQLAKADSGYSSNVSLRSFSLKPAVPEKDHVDSPRDTNSMPHNLDIARGAKEPVDEPRPPVPEKDRPVSLSPPRMSKELSPTTPQNSWLLSHGSSSRKRAVSTPTRTQHQNNGNMGITESSLSPLSPISSVSTLSISSAPRKQGRLQRLLSGARQPLTVHVTHPHHPDPTEKVGIPSIPNEVEAKLHEHNRLFPLTVKRLTMRLEPSKETLGTILSVGSAEMGRAEDRQSVTNLLDNVAETNETEKSPDCENAVTSTTANATALLRRPIIRKPVPIWTDEAKDAFTIPAKGADVQSTKSPLPHLDARNSTLDASLLAMASEREACFASEPKIRRSNPMTAQTERDFELHYSAFQGSGRRSLDDARSSVYLAPVSADAQIKKARTPPPVSMRMRNTASLRVPPRDENSLSRKTSSESIRSHPSTGGPDLQNLASLSRKSSREHIASWPLPAPKYPAPAPTVPPLNPRRSLSFRTAYGEYRRPNWEVQTDHDTSRRPSAESSRYNSLSSQSSQPMSARPGPRQFDSLPAPHLRHSASVGGYSYRRAENAAQYQEEYHEYYHEEDVTERGERGAAYHDNGPYPSMRHGNGQAYVTDPWSGRPMPQQWDSNGRYPPYVARGHYRNRSLESQDQSGHPFPYRVLHSYNSPAYRNVPIWR